MRRKNRQKLKFHREKKPSKKFENFWKTKKIKREISEKNFEEFYCDDSKRTEIKMRPPGWNEVRVKLGSEMG